MTTSLLNRNLTVRLTVTNALDGASRRLCDVQRFGAAIRSLRIDVVKSDLALVAMTIAVRPGVDATQISSRFSRHVGVLTVDTAWELSAIGAARRMRH
jgi:hypothetical protein